MLKESEEMAYLDRHKQRAKECHDDMIVVSVRRARAAVQRAYVKGYKAAIS